MRDAPLVSVVIPTYNAAATLAETLYSVRSQTHAALEIIVVDDGSTDDTAAIAARHAEADDRIQVLTQDNAGVAAARNTGWRHARSDMIAFVDADDLWAPAKIERQVDCLRSRGAAVGLVYCWSARIDSRGSVISMQKGSHCEGDVLDQLLRGNFVGNGSSALVRRRALIDAGGFETGLRAAGAEGCEDFLFYNRVAERYHFAVVPEHLVGYRHHNDAMSRDKVRMLRSWMAVCDEMHARHPDLAAAVEQGRRNYSAWIARDALITAPWMVPAVLVELLRRDPSIATRTALTGVVTPLASGVQRRLRRLCGAATVARRSDSPGHFLDPRAEISPAVDGERRPSDDGRIDGGGAADSQGKHAPAVSLPKTPEAASSSRRLDRTSCC